MKNTFLSLVAVASLATFISCKNDTSTTATDANESAVASTEAEIFKLDQQNSLVDWKGSKPTGTHTGMIQFLEGEARVNNGKLESGKFVIDMTSITVTDLKSGDGKEDLEAHLKGTADKAQEDHFFNVGKYPTGSFEITEVKEENGTKMVTGNLTLKDITKSVTFPATVTSDATSLTIKSDSFMIDRTQWNVNYASKSVFDDLKDKFVDDNIELTVNVKVLK